MKTNLITISSLFIVLSLTAIVSAQFGGGIGGYYNSPLDYLDNEWVRFAIIFAIFFAIIFYTVNKSFNNTPAASVIALGLSLLISITMGRRGLLYGYVGEDIGSWLLIIAALIGIGFIIRFAYDSFGMIGTAVASILLWVIIKSIDPYTFLPYELISETFINIYEVASSILGLIILIIILAVFFSMQKKKDENLSPWERMMKRPKRR
jgi:hypothetical protein